MFFLNFFDKNRRCIEKFCFFFFIDLSFILLIDIFILDYSLGMLEKKNKGFLYL